MRHRSIVHASLLLAVPSLLVACGGGAERCAGESCAAEDASAEASLPDGGVGPSTEGGARRSPPREAGIDAASDAGAPEDGSHDGAIEASVDAGPCVKGAPPAERGCVTDKDGVFVSPKGIDASGHGTMTAPFQTLSYALKQTGVSVVYVCGDEGAYTESVKVKAPVRIYGGMSCASNPWSYDASAVPVVTGTTQGIAALLVEKTSSVDVEDMSFVGADVPMLGSSSWGVGVMKSKAVEFHRVNMTAGPGLGAESGAGGIPWYVGAPGGVPAVYGEGGDAPTCDCGSVAGAGGSAGSSKGSAGTDGAPDVSGGGGGDGLGGKWSGVCSAGDHGANAPAAAGGAGGQPGQAGADGSAGGVGQGGGGGSGGALKSYSGGGGSGGCGGCPGRAGSGGNPGGDSIALLSDFSEVTVDHGVLVTGDGGKGGDGGPGQPGQVGGAPGSGSGLGCSGGFGGTGSAAGGGGGGGGGYSVGILYFGAEPTITGVTFNIGKGGTGGAAGTGGSPAAGAGADGISASTFDYLSYY